MSQPSRFNTGMRMIAVSKPFRAKLPKHADLLPDFDERPHRQIEIVTRV